MRRSFTVLAVSLLTIQAFGVPSERDDTLDIIFTGDILLDRGVKPYLDYGGMHQVIPDETAVFLRSVDIVVGNLECPATTIHQPAFKRYVFRGEPQWLDSLRSYGFTHLNLANNHSVDQGRQGLRDTRQNILRAGLIPIGADSTMTAAAKPLLLTTLPIAASTDKEVKSGRPVYLLASNRLPLESFAYLPDRESVSQEPFDSLLNRVRTLKKSDSTAVVIVTLHWGGEHMQKPLPQQRLEAHSLIDAGADVLIGHHPHCLQTIEDYKGKKIYYSIGNFIFDQQKPLNTEACVVRVRITQNNMVTETIPIHIDHCAPRLIHK
ncbi:MAG: CapA family protein [Prevotella sp.]|nr:CapA family protein [Prevotella sp.]